MKTIKRKFLYMTKKLFLTKNKNFFWKESWCLVSIFPIWCSCKKKRKNVQKKKKFKILCSWCIKFCCLFWDKMKKKSWNVIFYISRWRACIFLTEIHDSSSSSFSFPLLFSFFLSGPLICRFEARISNVKFGSRDEEKNSNNFSIFLQDCSLKLFSLIIIYFYLLFQKYIFWHLRWWPSKYDKSFFQLKVFLRLSLRQSGILL